MICVNSYALGAEVSDDKRFKKAIGNSLQQVRNLVSDGLFTVSADPLYFHQVLIIIDLTGI